MKKFNFKLESLLKYKSFLEKEAILDFTITQNQIIEEEKKLSQFQASLLLFQKDMEKKIQEGITTVNFKIFENYKRSLITDIQISKSHIMQLESILKKKYHALVEKKKEKKTIEKFKERQKAKFNENFLKDEQKQADERTLMLLLHKRN